MTGVPQDFVKKQAGYDLAIAVHPLKDAAHQDRVAIGGAGASLLGDTDWNADLRIGKVTRAGGDWSFAPGPTSAPACTPTSTS